MELDRLKDVVLRWLQPLERRVDYSAFYEAKVVVQNDDGSLELEPLTPKLAPISHVAIRYGVPGITAKIKSGGLVLVGFANRSPRKPFALVVDSAAIESISLFGGDRPIARMGDTVHVIFPKQVPIVGTVTIAGVPSPLVAVCTFLTPGVGQIQTGRKQALA